jgi:hypothetical protein
MSSAISNEHNRVALSTNDRHMNYEAVFDTFPWPQTPTVKQIDAVAADD